MAGKREEEKSQQVIAQALPCYIGLPVWQHPHWPAWLVGRHPLAIYGQYFNCIEANTTFWQLPSIERIHHWRAQVPAGFHFCCKVPQAISHHNLDDRQTLTDFLACLDAFGEQAGMSFLQLPASFGPSRLGQLASWLAKWPNDKPLAIEARHSAWHDRSDAERAFNQLLKTHHVERVGFDTRSLFDYPRQRPLGREESVAEALARKPNVVVKLAGITNTPMLRALAAYQQRHHYEQQWQTKIDQWREQGKTPYLLYHTPDLQDAPSFLADWLKRWQPQLHWPSVPSQTSLSW